MDQEEQQIKPKGARWWLWLIIILVIIAVGIGAYFSVWSKSDKKEDTTTSTSAEEKLTIPQKVLDNKFGWLGGGAEDKGDMISEAGGAWVRPHPGAFVWDMMQKSQEGEIDFSLADEEVINFQKSNLGILATIWPFADWDQKNLANSADCKVADNDEFLPKNDKKGRGSYLPQYRCNPSDTEAYQKWVSAIIERYDGDGKDDMPGLKMPIKYWEAMNEPDLQYQNNMPMISQTSSLNFYKQGPSEYAQLLIKTSEAIRLADTDAKILIAGAAGADPRMLNFYRGVFAVAGTKSAFDIGNVHCISNDRDTKDFNVGAYKAMLTEFSLTQPIWVTEAEAMYGATGEANFQSTKTSTTNAIAAGAQRIFFTRYTFDDFRTDMSKTSTGGTYPSAEKYRELIESF